MKVHEYGVDSRSSRTMPTVRDDCQNSFGVVLTLLPSGSLGRIGQGDLYGDPVCLQPPI